MCGVHQAFMQSFSRPAAYSHEACGGIDLKGDNDE